MILRIILCSVAFSAVTLPAQSWLYEEEIYLDSAVAAKADSAPPALSNYQLSPVLSPWQSKSVDVRSDDSLFVAPPPSSPTPVPVPIPASVQKQDTIIESTSGSATLQLVVLSAEDGTPLSDVIITVKVDSTQIRGTSDANGIALLRNIPPGSHTVLLGRKGYTQKVLERILFKGGQKVAQELSLERRIAKGALMEVKKPKSSVETQLLAKRQQGGLVMEGVSAEQIAKSTDADAGAIAKRVTGTSVVGGKYVYVRGLGERYTNMTLNGLPVPTPEKDKRVVPQDLFPASALESFAIYKTFSPNLPADFAGGSVALETKGIPEKDFFKIGAGVGATDYRDDSEYFDLDYRRLDPGRGENSNTRFGYTDEDMEAPKGMPDIINSITHPEKEDRAELARRWDRQWSIDTAKMALDQNYSVSMGRVWDAPWEGKTGFIANVAFKNDFTQNQRQRIKVANRAVKDSVTIIRNGKERRVEQIVRDTVDGEPRMLQYLGTGLEQAIEMGSYSTTLSGLLNWGYQNRDHHLWAKTLYANLSEDLAMYNYSLAMPDVSAGQENSIEERFYAEFNRRSVAVAQIGGGHYIGRSLVDSLSWALGLAQSRGETPDSRKYFYSRFDATSMQYDIKPPFGTRQFQDFKETGIAGRIDLYLVVPPEYSERDVFRLEPGWLSRVQLPTINTGFLFSQKYRSFDLITYSWAGLNRTSIEEDNYELVDLVHNPDSVAAQILVDGTGFGTSLGDYDNYTSEELSVSTYADAQQNLLLLGFPTQFQAGARLEAYQLQFKAPFTSERSVLNPSLRNDSAKVIDQLDWNMYPAASVHFEFFPRTKTRFLWSQTLVRPEIRERAPTFFYDPVEEIEVIGNPDLKDTRIDHFDFRFEWFLPYQQMISLSLFYKDFENPIEVYINGNLSPNRKMFQNADGAYVRGIEIEADISPYRQLQAWRDLWFLKGLNLYGNAAWMESKVRLDTTASGADLLTSRDRPMIGQSPYVYNFKITHESEIAKLKMMHAVLYNVSGRRIRTLGVDEIPDTYEEPFASLDYLCKLELGMHTWSIKVKNILDAEQQYTVSEFNHTKHYETISDEKRDELYAKVPMQDKIVVSRVKPGTSVSLNWEIKF